MLAHRRVRWVLAGSAVLAGYGGSARPRDLDVVPSLDGANLATGSASVLRDVAAVPLFDAAAGGVPDLPTCRAWRPPHGTVTEADVNLLFVTVHGLLDVVPHLCGDYPDLAAGATGSRSDRGNCPFSSPRPSACWRACPPGAGTAGTGSRTSRAQPNWNGFDRRLRGASSGGTRPR